MIQLPMAAQSLLSKAVLDSPNIRIYDLMESLVTPGGIRLEEPFYTRFSYVLSFGKLNILSDRGKFYLTRCLVVINGRVILSFLRANSHQPMALVSRT